MEPISGFITLKNDVLRRGEEFTLLVQVRIPQGIDNNFRYLKLLINDDDDDDGDDN